MRFTARATGAWALLLAASLLVFVPLPASADLPCPGCEPTETMDPIGGVDLVSLVASTVFADGLSLLLLGAFAVVGLPWLVAAVAIAAFYLPRWLRASR